MSTGYNIREGSQILAEMRAEREREEQILAEIERRLRVKALAREALRLLSEPRRLAA